MTSLFIETNLSSLLQDYKKLRSSKFTKLKFIFNRCYFHVSRTIMNIIMIEHSINFQMQIWLTQSSLYKLLKYLSVKKSGIFFPTQMFI